MPVRDTDPAIGFHFALEVQGKVTGYFTEISGLGSETEVIDHKVVTEKGQEVVQKLPGRLKWQDITLKRGVTKDMQIWQWRKMVEDGDVEGARSNGSIIMFDQTLSPIAQWNFERGWPAKVSGPQLQSDSNNFALEEMTIVYEYIERVK